MFSIYASCAILISANSNSDCVLSEINGLNFRCGRATDSECIRLSVLNEDCILKFVPGVSIPPSATEEVSLTKNNVTKRVNCPEDMVGCVTIKNPEDALEYLRFFSTHWMAYLFNKEIQRQEIFKMPSAGKNNSVCLPEKRWKRLNLREPIIKRLRDGFIVIRYIIRPKGKPADLYVAIHRETSFVSTAGEIIVLDETEVPSTLEDTVYLGFPAFL